MSQNKEYELKVPKEIVMEELSKQMKEALKKTNELKGHSFVGIEWSEEGLTYILKGPVADETTQIYNK